MQWRGCPEVSTGKLSRESTPKVQKAKSKTGGKKRTHQWPTKQAAGYKGDRDHPQFEKLAGGL